MTAFRQSLALALAGAASIAVGEPAFAQAPAAPTAVPTLDSANTAWILTATGLVLFMTLPGLALFYGGLVRSKNVMSVLMHCFVIACLVSVLWLVGAYGLAFGDGGSMNKWIGSLDKAFLAGVGVDALQAPTNIPELVFFMFQMTFAIITPGLIVGAYVERIKFSAVIWFSALWLILVYVPVAHWVWGGGWLLDMKVIDFAGGLVVHTTAGTSALVCAIVLGRRKGFPAELSPPHMPPMTVTGAAMLWVGWYGFNAGSALAANGNAGMAMTVTHIAAATASLTWMAVEWMTHRKPSVVGLVTGTIAGLATITPASGSVGPLGGLVIGFAAGLLCYWAVGLIKRSLNTDDSLDVFGVHGVGGMLGVILAAIFASPSLQGLGYAEGMTMGSQLWVQVVGVVATLVWSVVLTYIILKIVDMLGGLKVSDDRETEGLDITEHGERGYNL
jgi:Amt family ammonium transporter